MSHLILAASDQATTPIHALGEADLDSYLASVSDFIRGFAALNGFAAKAGQVLLTPGQDGAVAGVLFGVGDGMDPMVFRALSAKLPTGDYHLKTFPDSLVFDDIVLAFGLGGYRFDRYKRSSSPGPRLVTPGADITRTAKIIEACALARDMINTPAGDLGPLQIELIARDMAKTFGAEISVIVGDDLLTGNYPAVHAVGRAAAPDRAPRMIEMTWGSVDHPSVVLVGKGVTFDTGGLDIKPSAGMRQMKKDMGGGAHLLALGQMVMATNLPVRLTLLLPAVENAISGDAMRPGDVLNSRKGLTIEVGNTDAEGRLILADALTRAGELNPVLTLDLATLTGAARVALGPQLPPYFTDDEALAAEIATCARQAHDPVWRLPLWKGYVDALDSDIADIKNDSDAWAQAGSITAALFLQRFAPKTAWAHFDIFAWNPRARPGWASGAETQAIRGLFNLLCNRFS
ncbi:MAG: aminopeptidase [Phenylobacterium zucineum]|nr:MAG: aminopeptidase [Phenylobacterium zucineum]